MLYNTLSAGCSKTIFFSIPIFFIFNAKKMVEPIRTAFASYGMSGLVFHGPFLKFHSGFHVVTILERTKNVSAGLFPDIRISRSYDELLRNPEVELVIVNTPDRLHFSMAKEALAAGKHLIVEKPFTMSSAEAKELVELAGQKNLFLTVYQNRRWDGDFMTVKKVIGNKLTGRLIEFESHYDRYRNFIAPGTWKEEDENHAGVLYNLGSHMVDQVVVLFGRPLAVTAHLQIVRDHGRVFDYYDIRLEYSGFATVLKCSYLVREEGPRYIVHGSNGSFLKWGIDPQEEALKQGVMPGGNSWGAEPEHQWGLLNTDLNGLHHKGRIETIPGNYKLFYDNVFEALRLGGEPEVKPVQAVTVIEILEACMESHLSRKTIDLP